MRACSRFRTTTSSGCPCATTSPRRWRAMSPRTTTRCRTLSQLPLRLVFRNEKPGPGRFRQFMQFDADTVGSAPPAADAEMCMMAADTMEALGIPRGSYVVKVNNRKVLDGVMESDRARRRGECRPRSPCCARSTSSTDLAKRRTQLLGPGRKDESGDFTKGADWKIVKYPTWRPSSMPAKRCRCRSLPYAGDRQMLQGSRAISTGKIASTIPR